ncbi:hypothetical protein BaRGS_00027615 [Batillaria attramentaria]|uniref:Hexosyltransferase n=1 Tax=Batillaria attramentaria TaxID=370345 RepID=A0ABD0K292_9CAEN
MKRTNTALVVSSVAWLLLLLLYGHLHFKHDCNTNANATGNEGRSLIVKRGHLQNRSCPNDPKHKGYPCRDTNCTASFPPPVQRLRTIIQSQEPITPEHRELIDNLANQTNTRVNLIFVTAASANHYNESQGLLKDLHEKVFPFLKTRTKLTFKLVYYDLGLSKPQQALLRKHAKFEVIRFPFERLPVVFKNLKTCIWKPLLVKAHLKHSDVTFWMDASMRFKDGNLTAILQQVNSIGLLISRTFWMLPAHVAQPMLDYFRVKPCLLSPFYEMAGGFIVFKNELLVQRAIVDSWVACAFSPNCLCPGKDCIKLFGGCYNENKTYSKCHRFDQSAMAVILASLFDWRATNFIPSRLLIDFRRGEKIMYLPTRL